MPSYGTILCRNGGRFAPVMRGIGAFPGGSVAATFGAANNRAILFTASGDVINVEAGEYSTLANLGVNFSTRSGIITGWDNIYINLIPGSTISNPISSWAVWTPGNSGFLTLNTPDSNITWGPGTGDLWGNPLKSGIQFRQQFTPSSGPNVEGFFGSGIDAQQSVWDGPDLLNTAYQCPSWTNGVVDSFMQDGLVAGSAGPSLAIAKQGNTSYSFLTFDDATIQALFLSLVASLSPNGQVMPVPEGFLYSTGATQLLISGDGSYYKLFVPTGGDAVATQMLSASFTPGYTWDNSSYFPKGNQYFFYSANSGPLAPQVLLGELNAAPQPIYSFGVGCWPCHPTAQGIR